MSNRLRPKIGRGGLQTQTLNSGRGEGKTPNVSPDGRFLVFYSEAPLTRDDVRRVGGGAQLFRYDAQANQLIRVSVGANGFNDNGNAGVGNARFLNGPGAAGRRDMTMADNGQRVFFVSPVGLTSKALNDAVAVIYEGVPRFAQNVYEWEQEGVGSCPAGHTAGCVFLISDGHDVTTAGSEKCDGHSSVCMLGTDRTGANVFFTSGDQLVPGDTDSSVNVYDARICTSGDPCIASAPAPLPPCSGEACHGVPPATPGSPNVPSATFNGAGNLSPVAPGVVVKKCKRGFTHKQARCVRTRHVKHA